MKPVSGKEMCRALRRAGWSLDRINGSHYYFKKPGMTSICVPVHGSRILRPGTQHGIMKDAGLTDADL